MTDPKNRGPGGWSKTTTPRKIRPGSPPGAKKMDLKIKNKRHKNPPKIHRRFPLKNPKRYPPPPLGPPKTPWGPGGRGTPYPGGWGGSKLHLNK